MSHINLTENIKQAKGNECSQYKSAAAIFSSGLPICPIHIFSSDTRGCFAPLTSHKENIKLAKGNECSHLTSNPFHIILDFKSNLYNFYFIFVKTKLLNHLKIHIQNDS
jgi:hypothetical protein